MAEVNVFLDTMVYLHFVPLEQIDLCGVLGADRVTILVPRVTLKELEKQISCINARDSFGLHTTAKTPRQGWHSRQRGYCRICNLQILKSPVGFESIQSGGDR